MGVFRREVKVTKLLKDVRKEAGLDDPEDWPGRLDLALRAGRSLLIVEFMRPGLTVDEDHLNRFESYIRRIRLEVEALTKLVSSTSMGCSSPTSLQRTQWRKTRSRTWPSLR